MSNVNSKNEKVNEVEKVNEEVKEEKFKICIPINEINPEDKKITVGINERYATIIRGVETEVDRPVYEQLKNAGLV